MSNPRKVFLVGGRAPLYSAMFGRAGWHFTTKIFDADLVQFVGGADINPGLYDQPAHLKTKINLTQDKFEIITFNVAHKMGKAMAGICRGAQLLNVMCGGSMWQDVDKHSYSGYHEVIDEVTSAVFDVTSTHHQLMIPGPEGIIVAVAYETTRREKMSPLGHVAITHPNKDKHPGDPEIIAYPDSRTFCFQPHPEHTGMPKLAERYMQYLDEYLFGQE